tara:strand:- start:636 stop:1799 length:1164 start_codon:yes stop_codon:yes gene_type:complete
MALSKWNIYDNEITRFLNKGDNYNKIARKVLDLKENDYTSLEAKLLGEYIRRHEKRLLDTHEGIYNASDSVDVSSLNVPHYWDKTDPKRSVFVKNPNYSPTDESSSINEMKEALINEMKGYAPIYPIIKREENKNKRLFIFDPADIHIGKLCSSFEVGESYNNQIAVRRVISGCKGILNEIDTNSIDKVLLVIGNDILHVDNAKSSTTSGTQQDTDGMWHTNFLIAKKLYVNIIELLMQVADVHVVYNPSNHDYTNGFFLAQVIETHFRNSTNVTFDTTIAHRKYFVYGKNLIGTTHGDGAKFDNLPLLMANESKDWSNCKHKYIYTHHLHHKVSKDITSVCVEVLRSPSGTDSWHHRNGYQHSPKAVEGYVHDKEHGQIMRLTHIF